MKGVTMFKRLKKSRIVSAAGLLGIVGALLFAARPEAAFGKPPLGRSWPASQQVSMDQIDHSPFDSLLKKYVELLVNYTLGHGFAPSGNEGKHQRQNWSTMSLIFQTSTCACAKNRQFPVRDALPSLE